MTNQQVEVEYDRIRKKLLMITERYAVLTELTYAGRKAEVWATLEEQDGASDDVIENMLELITHLMQDREMNIAR